MWFHERTQKENAALVKWHEDVVKAFKHTSFFVKAILEHPKVDYSHVACPFAVVRGEGEEQFDAANIAGMQILEIPNAKHFPQLEQPAAFKCALGSFYCPPRETQA